MATSLAWYVTLPPSTRYVVQLVVSAEGVVSFVTPGPPVEEPDEDGVRRPVPYPPMLSMKAILSSIKAEDMDRVIAYVPGARAHASADAAASVKLTVAICTDDKGDATLSVEDGGLVEAGSSQQGLQLFSAASKPTWLSVRLRRFARAEVEES
ncbi:hypothetical protein FA95DRAFT_1611276 [Auriscalpium vulgare]|uniref:Uncharacterized protein n=1 Tax=Auriscalpium vulgare TaxID=40419 RepID=A0ACB8RAD8_9AGAM|nr:hypothetical protein FA95DRAFT_1611276 [Auriscalpium vulgare]